MKKLVLAALAISLLFPPLYAQSEPSGNISLMQSGEGTAGTSTYFNAYFWVTFTDANGIGQNILLYINSNPVNYTAYLIGGPYGSTRVYYAITSFNWTRQDNSHGNVSFHLHNTDAMITDIQVDSLTYYSQKPCTRCNVQTTLTNLTGSYEYITD